MNLSDTYVIRGKNGEISDYVFIDPSQKTYYKIPDRNGFESAVSFSVVSKISMNYPVVFEDLTTSHGEQLEKANYADVPPFIKRRLVTWLKFQTQPASGPAGVPKNLLPGTSSKSGSKSAGSDRIKDELVQAYPDTKPAEWKRRTRTKEADGIHRRFEHTDGRIINTIEDEDGAIRIEPGVNLT